MGSDSGTRRGLRVFVAIVATSLALGGLFTSAAGAAPLTNMQRAQRGAQWLANQIKANGGFVETFGSPDPTSTAYAVVGLRASGVDKPASDKAIVYLKAHIGSDLLLSGHYSPGAIADYVLAAVADYQDPRHFGGTAPANNLVNLLLQTQRPSGPDKGLFGAQDPSFDGAFRQGLALAALKAANVPATDTRVVAAISWLTKQQCANGLWEPYRSDTTTACPASDPNTFTGPDTNSTGMAVQGLAAWGKRPRQSAALSSLKAAQSSDGGFPFIAASGQASDPDSTALVIQAILAEGGSPNNTFWTKGTHTPFTALASYQLGCTNADNGAFFFPPTMSGNVFASVQSVPAMASKTLPVAKSAASTVLPLTPC